MVTDTAKPLKQKYPGSRKTQAKKIFLDTTHCKTHCTTLPQNPIQPEKKSWLEDSIQK